MMYTGALSPGFPIAMAEIEAQIAAEDLDGDGKLEMVPMRETGNR